MKILLPVDGSAYTKHMLSYLAAHGELLGPGHEYTALTVVPSIPAHAARFLDPQLIDDYHREQANAVLGPVIAFADQQQWKLRTVHEVGPAAQTIADVAQAQEFDLIVMGTHGHSAMGNVVLGSVATGVLARCKTPVLLVR